MALTFEFPGEDRSKFWQDNSDELQPLAFAVVWYVGMFIGIPVITEKNVDQVWTRIRMIERAGIRLFTQPTNIRPNDLTQFIGLKTNGDTRTKNQFRHWLAQHMEEDCEKELALSRVKKEPKPEVPIEERTARG